MVSYAQTRATAAMLDAEIAAIPAADPDEIVAHLRGVGMPLPDGAIVPASEMPKRRHFVCDDLCILPAEMVAQTIRDLIRVREAECWMAMAYCVQRIVERGAEGQPPVNLDRDRLVFASSAFFRRGRFSYCSGIPLDDEPRQPPMYVCPIDLTVGVSHDAGC